MDTCSSQANSQSSTVWVVSRTIPAPAHFRPGVFPVLYHVGKVSRDQSRRIRIVYIFHITTFNAVLAKKTT